MTFGQVVKEARRWPHGSSKHFDAMHDLYGLFRAVNGYHGSVNQVWDWVNATEGWFAN